MDRYAVMGHPIKHSKSPFIHRLFAEQTDQELSYISILVAKDGFEEAVKTFQREQGKGLNITLPFKEQAWQLADEISQRAERAKAVNTLSFTKKGKVKGDNTDGVGLVRDILHNYDGQLANKRILVLGAGGAVRGVLAPLLAEEPKALVIANRTPAKAEALAEDFADLGPISASAFTHLQGGFDWVINGTAASLEGKTPDIPDRVIDSKTHCYDMMYAKTTTAFNQWALERGAKVALDGVGMLVEQAAEAFRIWRGVMPATSLVIRQLQAK